jgi:hypothetical protein
VGRAKLTTGYRRIEHNGTGSEITHIVVWPLPKTRVTIRQRNGHGFTPGPHQRQYVDVNKKRWNRLNWTCEDHSFYDKDSSASALHGCCAGIVIERSSFQSLSTLAPCSNRLHWERTN